MRYCKTCGKWTIYPAHCVKQGHKIDWDRIPDAITVLKEGFKEEEETEAEFKKRMGWI